MNQVKIKCQNVKHFVERPIYQFTFFFFFGKSAAGFHFGAFTCEGCKVSIIYFVWLNEHRRIYVMRLDQITVTINHLITKCINKNDFVFNQSPSSASMPHKHMNGSLQNGKQIIELNRDRKTNVSIGLPVNTLKRSICISDLDSKVQKFIWSSPSEILNLKDMKRCKNGARLSVKMLESLVSS